MRFVALALISVAVAINYLDRAIIGVATPSIQGEFHLSPALMGVVFSAFSWSYFVAQLPGGLLLDRFGARVVYLFAIAGWSAATLLHAFTRGFASLIGLRLALGVLEQPCFPANSSIVAAWFPRSERGMAVSVYTAAEYVALGFFSPLLFWITAQYGWRSLFFLSGGLGLAFISAASGNGLSMSSAWREPLAPDSTCPMNFDLVSSFCHMKASNDFLVT